MSPFPIVRIRRAAAVAAVVAILMSACGGSTSAPVSSTGAAPASGMTPAMQALYDAAKKEGAVTWQGAVLKDQADAITKAFEARFPGIQATFTPLNEPQAPAQILTEATNGSKVVKALDVARGSPNQFKPLLDRDLLDTADWAALGVDKSRIQVDGKWLVNEDSVNLWTYNTGLLSGADVPQTWDDLLKARLKGKKIVTNSSAAGLYQVLFSMGEDKGSAFLNSLKGQDPVVVKTKGPSRSMVSSGQALVGVSTVKDLIEMKQSGEPVDGIPMLGPMERDVRGWYFPKGVQHPNAGKLFAAWIVTPEGWALQQKAGLDIATPCSASAVAKYVCDNNMKYTDYSNAGMDLFAYYDKVDAYQKLAAKIMGFDPTAG